MADTRNKDVEWRLNPLLNNKVSNGDAQLAVLMDLRDELKKINNLLHCQSFTDIPNILRQIRRKVPTPKKRSRT